MITSGDPHADLCLQFLSESQAACHELLKPCAAAMDWEAVKRAAHSWAGAGSLLGYPQVTSQARRIEYAMRGGGEDWRRQTIGEIRSMQALFTSLSPAPLSQAPLSQPPLSQAPLSHDR